MSEQEVAQNAGEQSISEQASAGVRARRAFMLKFLLGGDGDWINRNIVAKGKGTQAVVGRLFGVCTGTEDKTNILPDGGTSRSVVLFGQFEYESSVTGEIGQASSAYLPLAFADAVKAAFAADPEAKMLEVDIDIGLEATGKTIPYEWLVVNHNGGEAALLKRMRSRRRPGLAAPKEAPALEAPKQPTSAGPETTDIEERKESTKRKDRS